MCSSSELSEIEVNIYQCIKKSSSAAAESIFLATKLFHS